jgi:cytochrome c oxidase cbb3-type subunit 1
LLGGLLFLTGMLIMAYNMFLKTMAGGRKATDAPVLEPAGAH